MDKITLTPQIILAFAQTYIHSRLDSPVETPACHLDFWKYCCLPDRQVAIAAPRGHAKTTAITIIFSLASLLFRDSQFLVIVSDVEEIAKGFLNIIRREVTENTQLMTDFGIEGLIVDTKTDIEIRFLDGHVAKIICKGSGQRVRGTIWNHKRPDLIICDDLENDEIVKNADTRRSFQKWLRSALIPILSKHGRIRVVGTILHADSALEQFMPESQTPHSKHAEWLDISPLRTITLWPHGAWKSVRFRSHDGFDPMTATQILWPQQFSREKLLSLRQDFIDRGDLEGYAQEYLNVPIDPTTAIFSKPLFHEMQEEHFTSPKTYYCGTDFATSDKRSADYSAFAVVAVDPQGILNYQDLYHKRMEALEIIDTMFVINGKYKGVIFIVEKGPIWNTLKPILFREMVDRNTYLEIMESKVTNQQDKIQKAGPLKARMAAHGARWNKSLDLYDTLEMEFLSFPKGKHDDLVDACGIVPLNLEKMFIPDSVEEQEERDHLRSRKQYRKSRIVSRITGY